MKTIKLIALALSIVGGLAGLNAALAIRKLGILGGLLKVEGAEEATGKAVIIAVISIIGIIAGVIVINKPKLSGLLMIAVAIVGYLILPKPYGPASALFIISGVLALLDSRKKTQTLEKE